MIVENFIKYFLISFTIAIISFSFCYNIEKLIKPEENIAEAETVDNSLIITTKYILPCPFCGGNAKIHDSTLYDNVASIECESCHIKTIQYECVSREEADLQAIKAWNRRVYYLRDL